MSVISSYLGSVPSYYEFMVRKGWFLPQQRCALITFEYLSKVRTGIFFGIKSADIRLLNCFDAVKADELYDKIVARLAHLKQKPLGIKRT